MLKPVAIIKTLEDSPIWLDRRLITAYLNTAYRIFDLLVLQFFISKTGVGEAAWLEKSGFQNFAYISACNPHSNLLDDAENRRRTEQLASDLSGRLYFAGEGADPAGDWPPEPSFLIPDIEPQQALLLGIKYEQNAILYWRRGGVPELWWLTAHD